MMRVLVINLLTPGVQLHCGKNTKTLGLNIILQFFRKLKITWDLHNNFWWITKRCKNILCPSFFFSKEIGYGSLINRAFCDFSFSTTVISNFPIPIHIYNHINPCLTNFTLLYVPWKHQKTGDFMMFPGGIKWNIGWKWVTRSVATN